MKLEAVVSVIIALIIALVVLVKSKSPSYEWTRTLYLVNSGETLWSICQEYCPDKMDIQEYIYLVKKENNMVTSMIHEGDTLTLLKEVKNK